MIWWAGLDLIGNKFAAYGEIIIWRLLAWSTLDRWVFVGVHVQCLVWSAALHMYAVLNLCGPFARTARPSSYQIIIKLLNCFLSVWNWIIGLVLVSGEWIMHCEHRKGMNGVNGALICPACAVQSREHGLTILTYCDCDNLQSQCCNAGCQWLNGGVITGDIWPWNQD